MFTAIEYDKLMILLLFLFAEIPFRPKIITNLIDDFPIYRWIIIFLLATRHKNGLSYFISLYFIYQISYMIDHVFIN